MVGEEGYEQIEPEQLDEVEDQYDDSQDLNENTLDQYETYSQQKEKSDLFNWFWKVTRLKDTFRLVKTGNLFSTEIGDNIISVRDAMNLANLGRIFHHDKFGEYWDSRAQIISATSMARKGWFMDLSISQKKVRDRVRPGSSSSGGQGKWNMFTKKKETKEQ